MMAGKPETTEVAASVAYMDGPFDTDASSVALSAPLCSDEVYMFGMPWEPWLACDCGFTAVGDPTFMPAPMVATRRICTSLWLAAESLVARIAG